MLLWLVSVGGHLGLTALLHEGGAAAVGAATLLYLGVTLGAQQLVLQARAATGHLTGRAVAGVSGL